jgi:hypothetical protein
MDDLVVDVSQEKIDEVASILLELDTKTLALKNCISTVLKEAAGEEIEEIDVEPEENGNKIL